MSNLLCTECSLEKDESEFWPSKVKLVREKGWRGTQCKSCYRAWSHRQAPLYDDPDPDGVRECKRCSLFKTREGFMPSAWRRRKDTVWCRECHREYYRAKNRENPEYFTQYSLRRARERVAEVGAIKAASGCSKCGERHPACLDFHHTDASTKVMTVSQLVARKVAVGRIMEEIAKCVLLCANCHRKLHYDEGGHPHKRRDLILKPRKNPTMKRTITAPTALTSQ